MDTAALASTLVAMNAAATRDQFSVAMVKQANEMQQIAVNLLAQGADAGKALLASGVGGMVDRAA